MPSQEELEQLIKLKAMQDVFNPKSPEQEQMEMQQAMAAPIRQVPNAQLDPSEAAILDLKAKEARQRFDAMTGTQPNRLNQLLPKYTKK